MLRVVFAGTPEFARVALEHIYGSGHQVVMVMTQPDRPAGRGMNLQASPVKQFAVEKQIKVIQPTSLRLDGKCSAEATNALKELSECEFDVMVVAAYGLILPKEVFEIAEKPNRAGCLNIHASLLPRWRGAAPIHRAIEAGDSATGIAIMQMDLGLDTGPVVSMKEIPISDKETTASLHDSLALLGGEMIVKALNDFELNGELVSKPQAIDGVTYAKKILKEEARIDWTAKAKEIDQKIRAFNPFPGALFEKNESMIKAWLSKLSSTNNMSRPSGEILDISRDGVEVAAGLGSILLVELQKPGGKKAPADQLAKAMGWQVGDVLN
ncbi:methionyl-tRNA formyltransferase [Polynucleobacter victoriensis]|uniref:Methionyl-tRNA formyltransferase n=1 Tax=Polynucleobacter victoriensis TaxID=2049319 RepID=A0A212TCE0_9BURK|nr:methionyl-tRNA formyltransferase [Polynucleobacter victoriensis]SNC63682.1 methionyl-tRNA formyltransferase [Polynucleobacter victoriensis]